MILVLWVRMLMMLCMMVMRLLPGHVGEDVADVDVAIVLITIRTITHRMLFPHDSNQTD